MVEDGAVPVDLKSMQGNATLTPRVDLTSAAAVVRNLKIVMQHVRHTWHVVVIVLFYSSVLLAIEPLSMNFYVVGTLMLNQLSLDNAAKAKRKMCPNTVPRGTFMFSRAIAVPIMVLFHWWDRQTVHYLCTSAVMTESTISRNVKQQGAISVPCPAAVTNYQSWKGGVGVHNQLRLQKLFLQASTNSKKYNWSRFLGLSTSHLKTPTSPTRGLSEWQKSSL
ncbi:unnamed protein product [Phytophthora fragariaefolia]|uniref:Unnamed protein product n=1 Tax=Phytophthora fragariaefolia TaxID=1490495 RepID=A0A9W7D4C6_9STRA|nr:unnamed protein product [Phytophthora fragariaefolia]